MICFIELKADYNLIDLSVTGVGSTTLIKLLVHFDPPTIFTFWAKLEKSIVCSVLTFNNHEG